MYDFLKRVPLFASMPDHDLERLCEMVTEIHLKTGEQLFAEGSPGDMAYIIENGEIEILKSSGGKNVLLAVRKSGEVIGEMSLLESAPRFASGKARTDSKLLAISHDQLDDLLNTSPSAARSLLFTITSRLRSTELMLRQSEKMAQLGTLTAGIAHELNNPAAAAQRGTSQLNLEIAQLLETQIGLSKLSLSKESWDELDQLIAVIREKAAANVDIDALERSDREFEVEEWLGAHNVPDAWEFAPTLVNLGFSDEQLNNLATKFSAMHLGKVIAWMGASFNSFSLLEEINQGSERISEIVKSLKSYVYLDQAPIQAVDVHEGLNNTLVMLRHKLKEGIEVKRDYTEGLPKIQAYGSELNQVWTNIIDNAIDAMNGKGEIFIKTRQKGDWVIVDLEDNGPGIPDDIRERIFSPFFTTKAVGKGTGLGLNISYKIIEKHAGEVKVFSKPGKTRFQVSLPIDFSKANSDNTSPSYSNSNNDDHLREILESSKRIAVVGISNKQDQANHTVPKYLQSQGYEIIPVNPVLESVLGEKAYPDLVSIPGPVDVVEIFRRSEAVPEIVDQAIQIGAKVIWMQEGVINEAAAETALDAGLEVVMDTCMRATHKRLWGGK
ncbi:MAG TPA: CoA-binding protein [Anaerolineales bacterium]|nr:CoA-binding protein [Anaerolineales bacterium]